MPKARPSQVIVHRIELQDTERELLEQYLQNNTIQSYADAGKALAIPLSVGAIAVTAYLIADGVWDFATGQLDRLGAFYDDVEAAGGNPDLIKTTSPLARIALFLAGK